MGTRSISSQVDELVVAVHRTVPARHGVVLRPMLERWALPMPGLIIDLAEFRLDGSLSDDLAVARFPFLPPGDVADGLAAAGSIDGIDDDLRTILDARAETAADMWADTEALVERTTIGAVEALAGAIRPLAEAYRSLPLPEAAAMRLHHVLTGLRYERLSAHVAACDRAGLDRADAVALSAAWAGEQVAAVPNHLIDLGLLGLHGVITAHGRELRDRIESETEAGCESMWSSVRDLDGWTSALRALR